MDTPSRTLEARKVVPVNPLRRSLSLVSATALAEGDAGYSASGRPDGVVSDPDVELPLFVTRETQESLGSTGLSLNDVHPVEWFSRCVLDTSWARTLRYQGCRGWAAATLPPIGRRQDRGGPSTTRSSLSPLRVVYAGLVLRQSIRRRIDARLHRVLWAGRISNFGQNSRLYRPRLFDCRRGSLHLGDNVRISKGGRFETVSVTPGTRGSLRIGDGVTIEEYCHIGAAAELVIERDATLGSFVTILDHDHGVPDTLVKMLTTPLEVAPVHIGRAAWIGEKATILRGVTVGDGAVVGANAVVTKDVPAGGVAVGVPARVVRVRKLC